MGLWMVALIKKALSNNAFVMPGNGPTLLGMPDFECHPLLSMNCQMTNEPNKRREINEQTRQDKSNQNNGT